MVTSADAACSASAVGQAVTLWLSNPAATQKDPAIRARGGVPSRRVRDDELGDYGLCLNPPLVGQA